MYELAFVTLEKLTVIRSVRPLTALPVGLFGAESSVPHCAKNVRPVKALES